MPRPRTDVQPRIVSAARRRFVEDGVDAASLRHIARDAKTSIGMIHYYFRTKDELFLAVVEEIYQKLLESLSAALAGGGSTREQIESLYVRLSEMTTQESEIVRLVVHEALLSTERFEKLLTRFLRGHVPIVQNTLNEGQRTGELRRDLHPLALLAATMVLGGVPRFALRVLGEKMPPWPIPEPRDFVHQMVEVLFAGVGASSGEPYR